MIVLFLVPGCSSLSPFLCLLSFTKRKEEGEGGWSHSKSRKREKTRQTRNEFGCVGKMEIDKTSLNMTSACRRTLEIASVCNDGAGRRSDGQTDMTSSCQPAAEAQTAPPATRRDVLVAARRRADRVGWLLSPTATTTTTATCVQLGMRRAPPLVRSSPIPVVGARMSEC